MRLRLVAFAALSMSFVLPAACSSDDDPPAGQPTAGAAGSAGNTGAGAGGESSAGAAGAGGAAGSSDGSLPPAKAETTETKTFRLARAVGDLKIDKLPNPSLPEGYAQADTDYGDLVEKPGEAHVTRVAQGKTAPAPGPNAKRLVRFAHLADLQIADDESPTRAGFADTNGATSAALRPQDADLCKMGNAAVRSINAHHAVTPIEFVLMGGDNADSAQTNEVGWVLDILSGAPSVECDSGENDDLVAGPFNDGKDPFTPEGLKMPWKWVTGNHDVLVQGNLGAATNRTKSLGTKAPLGTRDYTQNGAVVATAIADERRITLDRPDLMAKIASHGDGHGIGEAQETSGKAFYHFDIPGTPLRFLVLDTAHAEGGASGVLKKVDVDTYVTPVLEEAKAQGKIVVISSHHASDSLTIDGGTFGLKEPDAMLDEEWRAYLGGYPVLFSMVGHAHEHRVRELSAGSGSYWEIMTSAIADFPNEYRLIEIWDHDNGWISLKATCVDLPTEGDPIVARARRLAATDVTTGWNPHDGLGNEGDRNVEVWIEKR